MTQQAERFLTRWPGLRDIFLFCGGILGVAHETLLATSERPSLLILFAAMMGLPAFLRQDGKGSIQSRLSQEQEPDTPAPSSEAQDG